MPIEIREPIYTRPNPVNYILDPKLKKAVEVALSFNQPLLLTGEPGTGKTLLAFKVAHMLAEATQGAERFSSEPLRFNTKTTSMARDLFYTYDAVGHFQQANLKLGEQKVRSTSDFIELQALGKAIAYANPQADYAQQFNWNPPSHPQSSVVLIDEIDKAPRDFTNDILNEIERVEFYIKEQDNYHVSLGDLSDEERRNRRILIIMTSNSEKNLPDAFLRRCVFYHIPFPDDELLKQILMAQLSNPDSARVAENVENVIKLFRDIRKAVIRKKPATAELVAFVKMLEMDGLLEQDGGDLPKWYQDNLTLLIKTKEDIEAVRKVL